MTNEQYLIQSYFVVGVTCLVLAIATYALLRRSIAALTRAVPGGKLGLILRRLLLLGLVLPAMAGFFSVTFRSCDKQTYETIVKDRSYLVAKNQEQLGTSMSYVCIALLVWGLLVSIGFLTVRKPIKEGG